MTTQIAPSLLAADYARLGEELASVAAGGADMVHLDIMDGRFVPTISYGPDVVAALRSVTTITFDVHLMIVEPWLHIPSFVRAGADLITVHAETCPHLHRTIQQIREAGVKAGVALNPATPVGLVEHVVDDIDLLLIMSVNPGYGGQHYLNVATDKLKAAARMRTDRGSRLLLQVDGGISRETAPVARAAGADVLVAGTAVFGKTDRKQAIADLRG